MVCRVYMNDNVFFSSLTGGTSSSSSIRTASSSLSSSSSSSSSVIRAKQRIEQKGTKSLPRRRIVSAQPFHNQFLISSSVYFGRISNAKISVTELVGLGIALNRTVIIPKIEECGADGNEANFDTLFDITAFGSTSVLSNGGNIQYNRLCGDSAVYIGTGSFPGNVESKVNFYDITVPGFNSLQLPDADLPTLENQYSSLNRPRSTGEALTMNPYSVYFTHGLRNDLQRYLRDPLLPDKLAERKEKCIILGRNFFSVNFGRIPGTFESAINEIIPHPTIRIQVDQFLIRQKLSRGNLREDSLLNYINSNGTKNMDTKNYRYVPLPHSGRPFLGIHLRMKDFLTDANHISFGAECNRNPEKLLIQVEQLITKYRTEIIVLATDDYAVPCARALRSKYPDTILLQDASIYEPKSCKAALMDQEILGTSEAFIGDSRSSFSQAIHQIRLVRHGRAPESSVWL